VCTQKTAVVVHTLKEILCTHKGTQTRWNSR